MADPDATGSGRRGRSSRAAPRRRAAALWSGGHRRPAAVLAVALLGVLSGVLAAAVVTTGRGDDSGCGIPVELTVLTSTDVHEAVQRTLRAFERYAAESARSTCDVVHLTAYPALNTRQPGGAPAMRSVEAQFARWVPGGLSKIGPRPDVWISDSPYDVGLARTSLRSQAFPVLEEWGPVAGSPLVVGLPRAAVEKDSLRNLAVKNNGLPPKVGWKEMYFLLQQNGVTLTLPDPASSDTGLFHLTGLDQGLGRAAGLKAATRRDHRPDAMSLLCSAVQSAKERRTALPETTAYLVSEAALVSYNMGKCGSGSLRPDRDQELYPLYLLETRPLRFTFTRVRWKDRQDPIRNRYARDFYSWLADAERGGRAFADAGMLRLPSTPDFCDTNGAMQGYNAAREDPACHAQEDGPVADDRARRALAAFEAARPAAQVLIGVDTSETMTPNLNPIRDAIAGALVPPDAAAGPIGGDDKLSLWRLPGPGNATKAVLLPFEPGNWKSHEAITSRLGNLRSGGHAAVYDMLIEAKAELLGLPNAAAPAPVRAVVLFTDGDGYMDKGRDPAGGTLDRAVTAHTSGADGRSVQLHIIAFGSIGCQGPLGELADRADGTCQAATAPELERQLTQVLSQLAKGR